MREAVSQLEEKTTSRRLYASLIDWFLGSIVISLPAIIATGVLLDKGVLFTDMYLFEAMGYPRSYTVVIAISCLLMGFFYFVIIPWKLYPQQTIGKKMCGLKIEGDNEKEPEFKQYVIRQFICLFFIEGLATNAGLFIKALITLSFNYYVDHYLTIIWSILTLLSLGLMIYTKKQAAFHDILAKTRIVYVEK